MEGVLHRVICGKESAVVRSFLHAGPGRPWKALGGAGRLTCKAQKEGQIDLGEGLGYLSDLLGLLRSPQLSVGLGAPSRAGFGAFVRPV